MKSIKNIISISILLSIFVYQACREPIDIDLPEDDYKLVVNGWIGKDSILQVNISLSAGILASKNQIKFINEAKVELYENQEYIEDLSFESNGLYHSSMPASADKTYGVKVSYKNYPPASAEIKLPKKVDIQSFIASYQIFGSINQYNDIQDTIYYLEGGNVELTFNDPADVTNYYFLTFTRLQEEYYWDYYGSEYINIKLKNIGYEIPGMNWQNYFYSDNIGLGYVFNDELFNGETHTVNAIFDSYGPDLIDSLIYINLYSVDKNFVDFINSYSAYLDASDNPLSEPVNVFSNIEGGIGLFAGYALAQDTLVLELPELN